MSTGVIRSMLLLDEPNISGLRLGIENYAKVFLLVAFIGALIWEFITNMKFLRVVKDLVLALIFMSFFYGFHTTAVDLSFKASEELLREVSPQNIFLRKWSEVKVKTADKSRDSSKWSFIDKVAIPNLNDLLGTALFLLSKVCILILKLIYTTVYYFTFIFAPVTAVLSFLPVSKNSMGGTIISSLWCILLPFVLVVFLALVGNSVQMPAQNGELAVSSMDQLIWIFGITLLMLLAPSFTFSLIKGTIASTADAVGVKMTGVGAKALVSIPVGYGLVQKIVGKNKEKGNKKNIERVMSNFRKNQNHNPTTKTYFSNPQSTSSNNKTSFQNSMSEKGGLHSNQFKQGAVKLSEMKSTQQNTKQNSVNLKNPSGVNLSNRENVKTNNISSKIPFGFIDPVKGKNINSASKTSRNLNSGFSKQTPISKKENISKIDHVLKKTEVRSKFEKLRPLNFKRVAPKEKRHEV